MNRISIQTVANFLGLTLPLTGSTCCPFEDHQDNKPSFSISSTGDRWICYGCGRKGGAIDLVKEYRGVPFIDAKKWLMGVSPGGAAAIDLPNRTIRPKPITENKAMIPESEPDSELYKKLMEICPLQPSGLDYLRGRGISTRLVLDFDIGQLNGNRAITYRLIETFGYQRTLNAGLLGKYSTPENVRPIFQDNLHPRLI